MLDLEFGEFYHPKIVRLRGSLWYVSGSHDAWDSEREKRSVQIVLNGQNFETSEGITIQGLLEKTDLARKRVAVLMDDAVVRKAAFGETPIRDGAQIEIVQMVGGG